jgi:hypothetical protein
VHIVYKKASLYTKYGHSLLQKARQNACLFNVLLNDDVSSLQKAIPNREFMNNSTLKRRASVKIKEQKVSM